MPEHVKAHLI